MRVESADGSAPYDIVREGEDVAAVAAAAGRDVYVAGQGHMAIVQAAARFAAVVSAFGR